MPEVFISHTGLDKPFVRKFSNGLQRYGLSSWVDEAEIMIGDSLIEKISKGITESSFFAIVISKNSVNSKWVQKELNIALSNELYNSSKKILPIVIDNCEIPVFLIDKLYADFRDENKFEMELHRFAESCQPNEFYKYFVNNIDISTITSKKHQVVTIISPVRNGGSSTMSIALTKRLSELNFKPLLVDFNFHSPILHNILADYSDIVGFNDKLVRSHGEIEKMILPYYLVDEIVDKQKMQIPRGEINDLIRHIYYKDYNFDCIFNRIYHYQSYYEETVRDYLLQIIPDQVYMYRGYSLRNAAFVNMSKIIDYAFSNSLYDYIVMDTKAGFLVDVVQMIFLSNIIINVLNEEIINDHALMATNQIRFDYSNMNKANYTDYQLKILLNRATDSSKLKNLLTAQRISNDEIIGIIPKFNSSTIL